MHLLQDEHIAKLDVIQKDHPNNVQECWFEMFQYWLQVDVEASWEKLITALQQIQQNTTAKTVRQDNLTGKVNWICIFTSTYNFIAEQVDTI